MKRAFKIIAAGIGTFLLVYLAIGVRTPEPNSSNHLKTSTPSEDIAQPAESIIPEVITKTETKTVNIPYEAITKDDNALANGTTRVVQEGSNGLREETYTVTYTDGVETSRELTSSQIVKNPVARITHRGTYVAPAPRQQYCANGTYINSRGETVCRPSQQNDGGATAICRDGSYSYSRSRRGTCSHHGGVRQWL